MTQSSGSKAPETWYLFFVAAGTPGAFPRDVGSPSFIFNIWPDRPNGKASRRGCQTGGVHCVPSWQTRQPAAKSDRPRPARGLAMKAVFQIHLWIGIIVAAYVLLIGTTGAAPVFRPQMQKAAFPGTEATLVILKRSKQPEQVVTFPHGAKTRLNALEICIRSKSMRSAGNFLLVFFCVFAFRSVRAGTTGRVNGVIKDAAGMIVFGATVSLTNETTGIGKTATTDRKGNFGFVGFFPAAIRSTPSPRNSPIDRTAVVHVDSAVKMNARTGRRFEISACADCRAGLVPICDEPAHGKHAGPKDD